MAQLLSDQEIRSVLGTIIKDGDPSSVRPNSYVLRLGSAGEYLTTGKEFASARAPTTRRASSSLRANRSR